MGENASTGLLDLIQALSPREKKYYKLIRKGGKNGKPLVALLFEAIEKLDAVDDAVLYKALSHVTGYEVYKVTKNALYADVLATIRQYRALGPGVDAQLAEYVSDLTFLCEKGLWKQMGKNLAKAKELAQEYERFHVLVSLYQFEARLRLGQPSLGNARLGSMKVLPLREALVLVGALGRMNELETELRSVLLSSNFNRFNLSELLSLAVRQLEDSIFVEELRGKSFELTYYYFTLKVLARERKDLQADALDWKEYLRMYIAFYDEIGRDGKMKVMRSLPHRQFSYMRNRLRAANNTTFEIATEELEFFRSVDFGHYKEAFDHFALSFYMSLRFACVQGDEGLFKAALEKDYSVFLRKGHRLMHDMRMMILANIGEAYFMFGNYKESQKMSRKVIAVSEEAKGVRIDMAQAAYLMILIAQSETGAKSNLYRTVRQAESCYERYGGVSAVDLLIVEYAKKSVRTASKAQQRALVQELVKEISKIKDARETMLLFSQFNFLEWFESKLGGHSFINRMRLKNGLPSK